MAKLWVPDGQAIRVEWYLTGHKAIGVNNISDDWLPHDVAPKRSAGFVVDPDVPRDDLITPEAKRRSK